jgi:hypothetical protein
MERRAVPEPILTFDKEYETDCGIIASPFKT